MSIYSQGADKRAIRVNMNIFHGKRKREKEREGERERETERERERREERREKRERESERERERKRERKRERETRERERERASERETETHTDKELRVSDTKTKNPLLLSLEPHAVTTTRGESRSYAFFRTTLTVGKLSGYLFPIPEVNSDTPELAAMKNMLYKSRHENSSNGNKDKGHGTSHCKGAGRR